MNIPQLSEGLKKAVLVGGILVCLMVGYHAFTSPTGVVVNANGEIAGIGNKLREAIQGVSFWKHQSEEVQKRIAHLRELPQRQAVLNRKVDEVMLSQQRNMETIYNRNPHLRPSPSQQQADYLRDRAEAIESAEDDQIAREYAIRKIQEVTIIQRIVRSYLIP